MDNQMKINAAMAALNYLTNKLALINMEMAFVPSTAADASKYQSEREELADVFASKIVSAAIFIAERFDSLDALEEDELAFINPLMEFLSQGKAEQTGVEMIEAERDHQIHDKGYDARFIRKNPQYYAEGQLQLAAIYTLTGSANGIPKNWPKEDTDKLLDHNGIKALTVAGAFCAAEIDRLRAIEAKLVKQAFDKSFRTHKGV